MPRDGVQMSQTAIIPDLLALTEAALPQVESLLVTSQAKVKAKVSESGRVSAAKLEEQQFAAHALSWLATYVEALRQLRAWAGRLDEQGRFGPMEALIVQIGFGEYLAQIAGGIPMSQGEMARLSDLELSWQPQDAAATLIAQGNSPAARSELVSLMRDNHGRATFGVSGLDEELEMIRDQFRRFADDRVVPNAHGWHLKDELIPMEIITDLAGMGVFGLTIPEEFGGFGLSKASMVVVSEELSRGYIGVGSLGTRSEIAAELILCGGTPEQKAKWLPGLASGEILPTAVFTEPNTGSDLGSLRTRAAKDGASVARDGELQVHLRLGDLVVAAGSAECDVGVAAADRGEPAAVALGKDALVGAADQHPAARWHQVGGERDVDLAARRQHRRGAAHRPVPGAGR